MCSGWVAGAARGVLVVGGVAGGEVEAARGRVALSVRALRTLRALRRDTGAGLTPLRV